MDNSVDAEPERLFFDVMTIITEPRFCKGVDIWGKFRPRVTSYI